MRVGLLTFSLSRTLSGLQILLRFTIHHARMLKSIRVFISYLILNLRVTRGR